MRAAAVASASRSFVASASNAASSSAAGMASAATLGASTRSKREVYSITAASPRARTSARIAATVASMRPSSFGATAVRRASAASKPGAEESSRSNSSIGGLGRCRSSDGLEKWLHFFPLELERGRIDDQPRADRQDLFDRHQIVGPERIAGADKVDDCVREPDQRRQFHRTVEADQIDVHALVRKMLARRRNVLGRNPESRATLYRTGIVERTRSRDDHATVADAKIDRLIQTLATMFEQHVLARHAEVRGTICHIRRHIRRAHDDEAQVRAIAADD